MSTEKSKYCWWAWATFGVLCVGCFAFFQWLYPYHLHHREQIMVYEGIGSVGFGFLGEWLSSWLTQYFYYRVAGPLIVTTVMALVWTGVYLLVRRILGCFVSSGKSTVIAMIVASLAMLWQALGQTSHLSTLQPPLALAVVTLTIALLWRRKIIAIACGVIAIWLMGNPFGGRLWAWPDMGVERRFAIDSEAYFGNWDEVLRLAEANTSSQTEVYYYNLANAINGTLPDNLLKHKQIGTEGLFPILGTNSDYLTMNALGEVWYRIGAMTDAEHCTMLGLVFSPYSTGSRYVKRLAEVNLANGEEAAAMKYLRILADTPVHGKWARAHMPGSQSEAVRDEIAAIRALQPQTDTLHLANDIVMTLRHMLQGGDALASPGTPNQMIGNTFAASHIGPDDISEQSDLMPGDTKVSPPVNRLAYDYLMCLHLINRNLAGFLADFDPQMPRSTLYDEALILALLHSGADAEQAMQYNINPDVMRQFRDFRAASEDDMESFETTYWYYYLVQCRVSREGVKSEK